MFTRKRIIRTVGLVTTAFLISFTLPTSKSYAASSSMKVQTVGSWVNQLFQKVWQQARNASQLNNTENSVSNNNKKPVNNTGGSASNNSGSGTAVNEEQSNGSLADKIIQTGEKFLGTPYQYGAASGQTRTFDCSSFTQYVYKQHGISLPRSSRQQAQVGTTIPRSQIKKGDLLFFKTSSSNGKIGHVAIYAGNNRILHTWGPGGVRYDSLSTKWLDQGYITAKRVIK